MTRPLIVLPAGSVPTDIRFVSGPPKLCDPVSTGYWLIFRKTVWTLHEDFVFSFTVNGVRYVITMKKGTKTDLASTPKAIYWLYPPWDNQYGMPSLGHDGLYFAELFERWFSDLFLRESMVQCGSSEFTQSAFYGSVRTWGWLVWYKHTAKTVAQARSLVWIKTETAG